MSNIRSFWVLLFLSILTKTSAQEQNNIITAVSFLSQNIDARSSGQGSLGVATPSDVYSQQWNAAKYIFSEDTTGASISFSPFNTNSSAGIYYASGTYFLKRNERSVWGAGFRYFNLGEIFLNEYTGGQIIDRGVSKPNEIALDISYSLKLNETFSMGVTGRYIRSDLNQPSSVERVSFNSVAFDIGAYYNGNLNNSVLFRHGAVISNLGPKVKYSNIQESYFIPITLKLGSSIEFQGASENTFVGSLEFSKLLVPTLFEDQINSGLIEGIFNSFSDAPGGISEELSEVTWALGFEYKFQDKFSLRTGYFRESPKKGFRNYITTGAGFVTQFAEIDLSYLINTSQIQNQIQNKIRLSLNFPLFSGINQGETPSDSESSESQEIETGSR